MSNQSSAKGNPASKRMSNPKRKARREACWSRGQKRKQARKKAAEEAQRINAETVANGGMTPWQRAKAIRLGRRAKQREEAA